MLNRREFLKNIITGSVPVIAGFSLIPSILNSEEEISSYLQKGNDALDNAEYEKAVGILEEGLKKYPNNKEILESLSRALGFYGQNLIEAKEFTKAEQFLTRASEIKNNDPWILGLLGRANYNLGKRRESFEAFQSVLKINPDDTYSRWMIEMLTQKPLPPKQKPTRPLTPLETQALAEQEEYLKRLKQLKQSSTRSDDLRYQINRIVIDPGHGGFDDGAVGNNKVKEKDIVLDIAKALYSELTEKGKKVFLMREADYYLTLAERTALANRYRADLFISIHCNSADSKTASGVETYYCSEVASSAEAQRVAEFENRVLKEFDGMTEEKEGYLDLEGLLFLCARQLYWKESEKQARSVQNELKGKLSLNNRGIHSAGFFVLKNAKMPSILVEAGFLSNPQEENLIKTVSFQKGVAKAISSALTL